MSAYRYLTTLLLTCVLLSTAAAQTKIPPPAVPTVPAPPGLEGPVRPETVRALEADVQTRLQTLEQANLPKDVLDATRAALEQQLKILTALQDTFRKRAGYITQLERLPQQVEEAHAKRQALAAQPAPHFPDITEQRREQYEAQLQATQAEIEDLNKQHAAGELRLAGLAKELEQLARDRGQVEKELLAARSEVAKTTDQKLPLMTRIELLDLRVQWLRTQADALLAERDWLTRRGPLQDALLSLAQTRLKGTQRDLETIKQALGQAIKQEQAVLTTAAAGMERKLEQTVDPVEALLLAVGLETVEIRQGTANYRQQLNRVSDLVLAQEKVNLQEKQDVDRLASLVEKYVSGERVAQRLQVAFARLRRELRRYHDEEVRAFELQLQTLTEKALEVDERLYEFDRQAEARLNALLPQLGIADAGQRAARVARVRQSLEEQKAALREQQQALATLLQDLTKLLTLHRERKQLLDNSYRFVLTKLFWLRDAQTISWTVVQEALAGAEYTARRLHAFTEAGLASLLAGMLQSWRFWLLVPLVFVLLPWAAFWARRRLRTQGGAYMARDVKNQTVGHKTVAAVLTLFQATIWPTYIAVVVWVWPQILPGGSAQAELELALIGGLQYAALLLWVGLLGQALCRRDGWGQQYLDFSPALCRFLRRAVAVGWLAALVFLVPHYVLVTAPAEPEALSGSLALARLCFTAFEVVLLLLLGAACRRGSSVMQAVLATSRQRHGVLWRNWPLLYLALLAGIMTIITLDLLGYRYAARSLWLRSAEALLVVLLLMAGYRAVSIIIDRLAQQRRQFGEKPLDPAQPSHWSLLQQGRHFMRLTLVLLGLAVIQHLYGLDQDLFGTLNAWHLLEVGKGGTGQPLWLTVGDLITAALILTGATVLWRNLPGLFEVALFPRVRWDAGSRYAFLTLSRYFLLLIALWWSLAILHLRWSSIQWIVAAASVGLGFGLQEIVSNFVSGLILLIERPISVGDFVGAGGQEGTVTRITIRATTIQNLDNQTVIIPNKEFISGHVTNWTLGDTYVRVIVPVGVAYGSDLELVRHLLTEVVTKHPKVLSYPPPQVLFRAFGESSLDWEIWFFVPSPHERFVIANDLLLRIDTAFREHGVQIPFPQRDLHLRSADPGLELRTPGNGRPLAELAKVQVTAAPATVGRPAQPDQVESL